MRTGKATWTVVVVYDSPETRETAVSFCDQLVQKFWHDCEFDVSWWPTQKLQEGDSAHHARHRATEADLVIFALPPQAEISLDVQEWVESWVPERGEREGALVDLISARESGAEPGAAGTKRYLRHIAHRAGMDYLTQVPPSISWQAPESVDSCAERAQQVTSVLDEILHHQVAPPGLANSLRPTS